MKKILLIDGNAIVHRAFHALPPFHTSKGEMTNAVFGFSSMLLNVIDRLRPEYLVVAFDKKGKTFRDDLYVEYKATRVKAPQTLYDQIPRIKEVVESFNIPIYEEDGFEADDVIGTLAAKACEHDDLSVYIATGDMDALQLVNDSVFVVSPIKGFQNQIIYGRDEVVEKYGIEPLQLVDYKGLKGDTSDNIPGVKGIGEKTAVELIKEYSDLEGIYENLDKIKPSIREKLVSQKETAFLSRHLGTIVRDVPIELDLEACKTHTFEKEKISSIFQELEFRSLTNRLEKLDKIYYAAKNEDSGQQQLF